MSMPKLILVGDIAPGKPILVGLMLLVAPGLDIGRPGGAGIPGGGPWTDENGGAIPFMPGYWPPAESGVGGPPERTPRGFLENERRIPPRWALLWSGYP